MNGESTSEQDRRRHLLMAALDGEVSAQERAELDRILAEDSELREEWDRMVRLKEVTGTMSLRQPGDEVWGVYWTSVYNRLERGIGWVLASIGAIVLLSWGAWKAVTGIIANPDMPLPIKLALLALITGGVVLLVSVARERLFMRARDPYREVER